MIDVSVEAFHGQAVLKFYGDLTIENAAKFKTLLMESIEAGDHLSLDLAEVGAADVAGLQLLCAAHRAWRHRNKESVLIRRASEAFRKVVRDSGYARTEACIPGGPCLWVEGETDE
jgi:anti-anti-sigma factor